MPLIWTMFSLESPCWMEPRNVTKDRGTALKYYKRESGNKLKSAYCNTF